MTVDTWGLRRPTQLAGCKILISTLVHGYVTTPRTDNVLGASAAERDGDSPGEEGDGGQQTDDDVRHSEVVTHHRQHEQGTYYP